MIVRKILTLLALTTLAIANQTIAQSYDSNPSAQKMHYYDIADFEMQASDINYADHIAPILQRSCLPAPLRSRLCDIAHHLFGP